MVVLILLLLGAGCIAGLLYAIYSFSPEGRWRRRVRRDRRQLNKLRRAVARQLAQLNDSWRQQQHSLLQEALDQRLARISVRELDRFSGIGPKTVETLRQVGLDNLQKVRRMLVHLPAELGSRAELVRRAVLQICGEFLQTWQQEPKRLQDVSPRLYEEWTHLQTRYQQNMHQARESLRRQDELHRELERLYRQYRQVTGVVAFWRRLLLGPAPGWPVAAPTSPLFDIESELARLQQSAWATSPRPPIPMTTSAATPPRSPSPGSHKTSTPPAAVVPPKAGPVPSSASAPAPTPNRPVSPARVTTTPSPTPSPVTDLFARPAPSAQTNIQPAKSHGAKPVSNSPAPAAGAPPKASPAPASGPAATPNRPAPRVTLTTAPSPPPAPAIDPLDLEISLLYMLARSDGRLAQQERFWIADYCLRHYSRDPVLSVRVRSLCTYYEQAAIDPAAILAKLQQCRHHQRWRVIWPELKALARARNSKDGRKWQVLKQLAEILALPLEAPTERQTSSPPQQVHHEQRLAEKRNAPLLASPPAEPRLEAPAQAQPLPTDNREQACQLLGLSAHDSLVATHIRQKYRELLPLYNPKQEEIKGPEFVALAEQKRRQLREAACLLLRQCGVADPQRYLDEQETITTEYSRDNPTLDAIFGI